MKGYALAKQEFGNTAEGKGKRITI